MSHPSQTLTAADVESEELADWRMMIHQLHGRFETGSFTDGVELIRAIAEAAEEMNHHPDIDLTYARIDVRLTSHDVGGVTQRDVVLARTISELAAGAGATPRPDQTSTLELGLDTWDAGALRPFYVALLGYEETDQPDEIVDPDGSAFSIWFQDAEEHPTPAQRWHFDLRLPPEEVPGRIEACLAAGGTLVDDSAAPAFWVLADPQGNKSCLTTWQGR